MKRIIALIAMLSYPVYAQNTTTDVPIVTDIPNTSVRLKTGQIVPFDGQLLSLDEHVRREKINERNAKELATLKAPENVTVTKAGIVTITVGAAVLGAVIASLAIGFTLANPPPTK